MDFRSSPNLYLERSNDGARRRRTNIVRLGATCRSVARADRVEVVIPWIILAVVAVPLVVIGFASTRRRLAAGEHPATEDVATRERTELEFAEAEAYQEQWREEHKDDHRERIP
jgi:hypothetical protein